MSTGERPDAATRGGPVNVLRSDRTVQGAAPGARLFANEKFRRLRVQLRANTPVPRHAQIYTVLHELIVTGQLGPGDMIPSQDQLSTFLIVCPATVRKATQRLVSEADLIRTIGKGFTVAERADRSAA